MTRDWEMFFPAGTRVLALPSWRNPRIYLPTRYPWQRWEQSAIYPASRLPARLYRLFLRTRAATSMTEARTVRSSHWTLQAFAQDVLPSMTSAVIMAGTPGPTQHFTVQLWDDKGRVLGYAKYAEKRSARKRLRNERLMLSNLPDGIAPEPLKFGAFGEGEALLKEALPGKPVSATIPPQVALNGLLDSLVTLPAVSLEAHPWARRMRERRGSELDDLLEPLSDRLWPVAVQHGDFAPWNMLEASEGKLMAVDWECGTLEGLPLLDHAYYFLQTLALVYRRAPSKAERYTAGYLARQPGLALTLAETLALTRLAAYDAYWRSLEDGESADTKLQKWRREIWKRGVSGA